jgi:hypothetical protein
MRPHDIGIGSGIAGRSVHPRGGGKVVQKAYLLDRFQDHISPVLIITAAPDQLARARFRLRITDRPKASGDRLKPLLPLLFAARPDHITLRAALGFCAYAEA